MKNERKTPNAYMTLEAAIIMPIVFAAIVLIIYMWFFQYDRCLMEQDSNAVALKTASAYAQNNQIRYELMKSYVDEIYEGKYVAWDYGAKYGIEKNKVKVSIAGKLLFPFGGTEFVPYPDIWESRAENVNSILSPAFVTRQVRKMSIANERNTQNDNGTH
ncbi:MAG: hypothetical protein IJ608_11445 [Lachnospiraceae bacterium]|nr:hypothetical protein [Lachnospiraceae bacterium]